MFREMRRKKQMLSRERCLEILKQSSCGVLAVSGDDAYPYAVPLSFVYDQGKIYFHSALEGHKIDALKQQNKASFCIIANDDVVPEKYTTYFRSVIAFGKIRILNEESEIQNAVRKLALKYVPEDSAEKRDTEIDRFRNAFCMLELTIEHLSGKEAKELANK